MQTRGNTPLTTPSGNFVLTSAAFSAPALSLSFAVDCFTVRDSWEEPSYTQMPGCYKVTQGGTSGPHLPPCFPAFHLAHVRGIAMIENRETFFIP